VQEVLGESGWTNRVTSGSFQQEFSGQLIRKFLGKMLRKCGHKGKQKKCPLAQK
jgi:hypothetical protein